MIDGNEVELDEAPTLKILKVTGDSQYLQDLKQGLRNIEWMWVEWHSRFGGAAKETCEDPTCRAYKLCHAEMKKIIEIYEKALEG